MSFVDEYKITNADRTGKGVVGLPDTPGLSTGDMQARFDSLGNLAIDKFNAMVEASTDTVTNDDTKFPTCKGIVDYVSVTGNGDMLKAVYDTDDDGVVDNAAQLNGHDDIYFRNEYVINLPTTGYTSGSVTIWGESKTLYSKTITTDKDGSPLTNFSSGMTADYPINISGSNSDFAKLYAFEIGNGSVTVYMTSAPSAAFNVMIKEG